MTRTQRLAGITVIVLAVAGALASSARVEAPRAADVRPTQVAPDPARAGIEATPVDVEPVAWARAQARRVHPVGARVDALLVIAGVVAAALLALAAVATAARVVAAHPRLVGFRRRAPPLLLSV